MEAVEIRGTKTTKDLLEDAGWFLGHTVAAVLAFTIVFLTFTIAQPNPDSSTPKLLCTALSLFIPMIAGFFSHVLHRDSIAGNVWISGLLTFGVVCVHVLDLPTGSGLCDGCGALDKLTRTFFTIDHNSGLMAGDGLLIGAWIPLSMIGYGIGAKIRAALVS